MARTKPIDLHPRYGRGARGTQIDQEPGRKQTGRIRMLSLPDAFVLVYKKKALSKKNQFGKMHSGFQFPPKKRLVCGQFLVPTRQRDRNRKRFCTMVRFFSIEKKVARKRIPRCLRISSLVTQSDDGGAETADQCTTEQSRGG